MIHYNVSSYWQASKASETLIGLKMKIGDIYILHVCIYNTCDLTLIVAGIVLHNVGRVNHYKWALNFFIKEAYFQGKRVLPVS